MPLLRLLLPTLGAILVTLDTAPAAAPTDSVAWRRYGRDAFTEAEEGGKPVFLVLTAPWNWDHFLLRSRNFSDVDIVEKLNAGYVPIHADVAVYPELRRIHSLTSGLVPSFHFLDAAGRSYGAFPPLGVEELSFYLDDMRELGDRPPLPVRASPEAFSINEAELANRVARILLDRFEAGERVPVPLHWDLDPSSLSFLLEFGVTRSHRRDAHQTVDGELRSLLASALFDPVDGGFHRAAAVTDLSAVHHEKLLRPNAELGGVLASWYRMTGEERIAAGALQTLDFLNRRLRKRDSTLYGGSMAADVYAADRDEIVMEGRQYYRGNAALRSRVGIPPVSRKIPVGANFVLHQALVAYRRAFGDERLAQPARWSAGVLVDDGFEPDGLARRSLGFDGAGNLRDQGDAGSGLLAIHQLTGNRRALDAAVRLAERIVDEFRDDDVFRNVGRGGDAPAFVRDADPDPAWNGNVLRFLGELAIVTGDERWRKVVRKSLEEWATRMPFEDRGIGELGRAALRVEAPCPLLVIVADPESARGRELRDLAFRLYDRLLYVRWIDPATDERTARRFGIDLDEEPALYLRWDRLSPPIRDAVLLRAAFDDARERVREK